MNAGKPDILIYMSDQHDGRVMGAMGDIVRTPVMDSMTAQGLHFTNAYTSCPLCVPARMSFLTGRLPSGTRVFTNKGVLDSAMPTFLHGMLEAGYETVLCGRMHFVGPDQRHGFVKRIANDLTANAFGSQKRFLEDAAPQSPLVTDPGCLAAIGGGDSLSLAYDRYVVGQAEKYLAEPHERPQLLVVGTYAPHYPYIAPPEKYEYYRSRVTIPPTAHSAADSSCSGKLHDDSEEVIAAVRATYRGMIEFEDECLGRVRKAWKERAEREGRAQIMFYLSDHGDQNGDRGLFGKQTLYEASVRIPFLCEGDGVPAARIDTPVSLMDVGPTLLEMAGAKALPAADGRSLLAAFRGEKLCREPILAEWITAPYGRGTNYGRMIRNGAWKLISYPDHPKEELLTRPDEDPYEQTNLAGQKPALADTLRESAFRGVDAAKIVADKNARLDALDYIAEAYSTSGEDVNGNERWTPTRSSRMLPEEYLHSELPLPPRFAAYFERTVE